jgi:outer membrane usher protein
VTFDPRRLELEMRLPPELREKAVHDQGNRVPAEAARALPPSAASGFLNARGGGGAIWSTADLPSARPPLHLNLESAVNVRGFVLEGRANFAEGVTTHRGDVLLSRDEPTRALRFLAGDFVIPGTTFQPGFPILGFGILRSFALQPYRVTQPAGQFDFLLERPSQVTVYANGTPVQTLTLPAGPHDVRDLPLGAGVNDLELVIRDDRGIERRLSFATATAGTLLVPGLAADLQERNLDPGGRGGHGVRARLHDRRPAPGPDAILTAICPG